MTIDDERTEHILVCDQHLQESDTRYLDTQYYNSTNISQYDNRLQKEVGVKDLTFDRL